jgi:hypothetical protein
MTMTDAESVLFSAITLLAIRAQLLGEPAPLDMSAYLPSRFCDEIEGLKTKSAENLELKRPSVIGGYSSPHTTCMEQLHRDGAVSRC